MFKNLTIGQRLGLGFGLILLLMFIAVGASYYGTFRIYDSTSSVLQNEEKMAQFAANVRGDVQGMRRYEKDILLNIGHPDKVEESIKLWQESERKAYEGILALEKLPLKQDDRPIVASMKDNFTIYVEGMNGVLGAIRQGRIQSAQAANDALAEYQDASKRIEEVADAVRQAVGVQLADSESKLRDTRLGVDWTDAVTVFLASIFCLGVGFWLTKSVSQPILEVVKIADQMGEGDFSARIEVTSTDETGRLLTAIKNMTDYLREMADVATKISVGNLNVHVVPKSKDDRFGHAFKQMTDYLGHMASISDSIATGNLSVQVKPLSKDDRFGHSFKNMLDNTLSLVQSQDERDALQKSIVKLLDEVADVAQGDLTKEARVSEDVTGAIADALNFMIAELRRIIGKVQAVTWQVNTSANATQVTTEHLARGSEEQVNQILVTTRAINEMATSIQQVSANAALSASVAQQSLTTAKQGTNAVQNTIEGMNRIRDQVQETAKRLKRLGESSQEIGEIVQLIEDIADRTSILALNASIQAAMAGEAGRGFAVVAEEVERLADRSSEATKKIAGLVKTIQLGANEAISAMEESTREVVEGSQVADKAGQSLSEIEAVSHRLSDLIGSISLAAKQQASSSEALSKSMTGISGFTQETATGIKQAAVTVSALANLADELRASVASFKLPEDRLDRRGNTGALPTNGFPIGNPAGGQHAQL
ncbi:MAG TPA: methyl-accepting chemotaxis protein [Blastocatellia bacterium]|nr:methyl-accepting chemotaxis protein [Blastocatellia bacterium]